MICEKNKSNVEKGRRRSGGGGGGGGVRGGDRWVRCSCDGDGVFAFFPLDVLH